MMAPGGVIAKLLLGGGVGGSDTTTPTSSAGAPSPAMSTPGFKSSIWGGSMAAVANVLSPHSPMTPAAETGVVDADADADAPTAFEANDTMTTPVTTDAAESVGTPSSSRGQRSPNDDGDDDFSFDLSFSGMPSSSLTESQRHCRRRRGRWGRNRRRGAAVYAHVSAHVCSLLSGDVIAFLAAAVSALAGVLDSAPSLPRTTQVRRP